MQRIVKWSPVETQQYGWDRSAPADDWMGSDVDAHHVEWFDVDMDHLVQVPALQQALTRDGQIGTIREMTHEMRDGQRIFIFLVDFGRQDGAQ